MIAAESHDDIDGRFGRGKEPTKHKTGIRRRILREEIRRPPKPALPSPPHCYTSIGESHPALTAGPGGERSAECVSGGQRRNSRERPAAVNTSPSPLSI